MILNTLDDQRLAYLDTGGDGVPIIALHGHFGRARQFAPLMDAFAGSRRVIALEQRGHGLSRKTADYPRDGYLEDVRFLMDSLSIESAVLLGFSLGGVNAYQFAARFPSRVRGLIIEDIGAVVEDDLSFVLQWPERFPSVRAAQAFMGEQGMGSGVYFLESLVEYPDGWGFHFDRAGMVHSQQNLNGDWWADWLTSTCPALLIHGGQSGALSRSHAEEMRDRRPHTTLVTMPECGHGILHCDFNGYRKSIEAFLEGLGL